MALAVVGQPNWRSIPFIFLLVERSHALDRIGVNLDWSVINLGQSLKLNIVSPNSKMGFPRAILLNRLVRHKALEVIFPNVNILHTLFSDNFMQGRVPINLMCDSMEQTVPITCHFCNLQPTLLTHFLFKIRFPFFPVDRLSLRLSYLFNWFFLLLAPCFLLL